MITHGTATLEETAYFLGLTLKLDMPVVLVGSQRPSNTLSSDAALNLYNGLRVAAEPAARGLGVLVVLNDEIHAARDVTKTSTYRLQTFRSPASGVIVVMASRGISGRVAASEFTKRNGFLVADNLSPQKARLLLSLCLIEDRSPEDIQLAFSCH